jgi:hypothetical protein
VRPGSALPLHATGLAFAALSLFPHAAQALEPEPVRVEVRSAPGCSDDAAFFAEVRGRTRRVRLASAAGEVADHTLRVRLDRAAHGVTGELVVVDAHGTSTRRVLAGETCEAVVSGLAWVAARAIDPEATFLPVADVAIMPEPVPQPPTPPLFPCAALPPRPEPPPPEPPEPPLPPRWRVAAGATASVVGVGGPGAIADVGVFAEVARDSRTTLAPAFRLSVHHTSEADVSIAQTNGAFVWTFARAEVCPWRFGLATSVDLRACGLVDAGVLSASGGSGAGFLAGSHLRPWFTVGELARLGWAVAGPVRVELEGGLTLPLVRDTFAFDAATTVYPVPVVVGFAGAGVAVRFP